MLCVCDGGRTENDVRIKSSKEKDEKHGSGSDGHTWFGTHSREFGNGIEVKSLKEK